MSTFEQGVVEIRRLARDAALRIRLVRALELGSRALLGAIGFILLDVSLRKVGLVGERAARTALGVALVCVLGAAAYAWARKLPEHAGARALDRFHDLHDRFASALAFAAIPAPERTAFMQAAIEDASRATSRASPRGAVPIAWPRSLAPAAALACALFAVMLFEVRRHVPAAHLATIEPVDLASDDLEEARDFLAQLKQLNPSDDARVVIEEFNKLIGDLASHRIDRTEAFRRLQALEDRLPASQDAQREALSRDLQAVGEELKKSDLSRAAGATLNSNDLGGAREELRELARKLKNPAATVDKARLEQLREALKKASEASEKSRAELEKRREELSEEILKMKDRASDAGTDEERSLLRKKEQELERLDRELDAQKSANRELERLDRELDQAAEDLMKDLGLSAKDLEQSAEDLNRLDQEQMTQQQKEQLRQKLEELRELLRQQAKGGQGQLLRLKRFGRMARGGSAGGSGQEGQGQGQGQGSSPSGGQQGQGGEGGQGAGGGQTWILGPGGEKMLMLSKGSGSAGQQNPGGNGGGQEGASRQRWGEGHDPHLQGAATNPDMATSDTQVQGADTGQGGSRSQVILGAAERGFTSQGYRKVYTEYHQVAEESLARDEIPGGYRFYVKRYFQLIRPRDERPQ